MKGYFIAFVLVFVLTLVIGLTEAQSISLPDLIVSDLAVQPSTLAGIKIFITDVTQNKSTATASAPYSVTRYYLSKDKKVSGPLAAVPTATRDKELATRIVPPLDPGAANTGSNYVQMPIGIVPGDWYIIALADAEQLKIYGGDGIGIDELYENNNSRAKLIHIYESSTYFPDLTVTALGASTDTAAPGDVISVSETTKNLGPAGAPTSITMIYLSTDSTVDGLDVILYDPILVPGLIAGASKSSGSISVTIPADTTPGSYYIIAKADGPNVIVEAVENNNAMSIAITISAP